MASQQGKNPIVHTFISWFCNLDIAFSYDAQMKPPALNAGFNTFHSPESILDGTPRFASGRLIISGVRTSELSGTLNSEEHF